MFFKPQLLNKDTQGSYQPGHHARNRGYNFVLTREIEQSKTFTVILTCETPRT